jgi:hypothetical protein
VTAPVRPPMRPAPGPRPGPDRRVSAAALVLVGIVVVTALRSGALLGYSNWIIDEEHIVSIAAGFLGFDLDPRWFNYHPLPMYVLGAVYQGIYLAARAVGMVTSRVEFASLLYGDDAVFYVPAKLLGSFAYTAGCAVLAGIAWRRTRSRAGTLIVFVAPLFLADGIASATHVRNDSFVFLFLALTAYFACFADKRPTTAMLAVVCCAAAVASKVPAVVLVPVLFLRLALDARAGALRWRHLAWGAALFAAALFLFMPYAFLDFAAYRPALERLHARALEGGVQMGKVAYTGLAAKLGKLGGALVAQTGWVPVAATAGYALLALLRDRAAAYALLFPLAYLAAFATSATLDAYWLRPVYPFLFLFPVLLVLEGAGPLAERAGARLRLPAAALRGLGLALVAMIFLAALAPNLPRARAAAVPQPEDTRGVASHWIRTHLPPGTRIVMVGWLGHYLPRVVGADPLATLWLYGYPYDHVFQNRLLMEGFRAYYRHASRTEPVYRLVPLADSIRRGFRLEGLPLRAGDYVVISSRIYARYERGPVTVRSPELAAKARAFYAYIRSQEPVRTFTGNGPTIQVYRMRESAPPEVEGTPPAP